MKFCVLFCFKQNRSKLVTYVVATGLTYGVEEGILHYLFTVHRTFCSICIMSLVRIYNAM